MKEPVWLLKPAVIAVHGMLIARFGAADGIRDDGLLDSALGQPVNVYHCDDSTDVAALAAAYAAGLIQNHPLVDGNNRTGFVAAYIVLDLNCVASIKDARSIIRSWRKHYYHVRPHRSPGRKPPAVFAKEAA